MNHRTTASLVALVLAGAAIATEPAAAPAPNPEAMQAVQTLIVARLERSVPPFSRVSPPPPPFTFHQWVMVEGEKRLPFEVTEPRGPFVLPGSTPAPPAVLVTGYVRQSDHAVFVFDTRTQKHIPAELDPRFAPPKTEATTDLPG